MPASPFSRIVLAGLLLAGPALAQSPVKVVAAGDLACDPADASYNGGYGTATACRMRATSDLALALAPAAVLVLGDNQYEDGALAKYQASYAPSWGRLAAITHPVPGNHEYVTAGAAGYFGWFGAAAGDPAKGYSSFDLGGAGGWHLIALNSNCTVVGGCGAGSPEEQWLAADLAAHPGVCTLAYWHHPRFSSGPHGDDPITQAFWNDLQAARADVVLNGHDHIYERFAPQSPAGAADPDGVREFVVGTGGKNLTSVVTVRANSEVRRADTFGVLELTLHPNGYEWRFVAVDGTVVDSGVGLCHSALPSAATDFYTVEPCRLADTREADGPALAAGETRTFPGTGRCAIPADAVALALNVTAVQPAASGNLKLFPTGAATPLASVVNFAASQARANGGIVALGVKGGIAVQASGSTHVVIDVSGYFR